MNREAFSNVSMSVDDHARTTLEQARTLGLRGDHAGALAALETLSHSTPASEGWRGLMLIFAGDLEAARSALTNALARGYRGAVAGLATIMRVKGEPRDGLLDVPEHDLDSLDDFDRASLEREIGLMHKQKDEFDLARVWFERAWRTAQLGPYGSVQMSAIAQALGYTLGRLGYDALAVAALDEGLRHTNATRRVPLLYERTVRHLNLARLEAAGEDLEELRTFIPNDPNLALLVRYAEARLQFGLGDLAGSRTNFELALYFAALHSSETARETAFYAALWLVRLDTDALKLDAVEARLERAATFARGGFDAAWLAVRRARFLSASGRNTEAVALLEGAVEGFSVTGARRETGIARLHRAEVLLQMGTDHLEAADLELIGVAHLARELGGTAAFQNELVGLTNAQWHLEVTQGWVAGRALLEEDAGVKRVRVAGRTLERGDAEISVPVNAARLAAYLLAHPCSTWAHLRWGVYADVQDDDKALEAFDVARGAIETVRGVRVVYRAERHAYSLVWEGVSLER
jgi:tetratricopeptide (TPR) repeat protein